MRHLTLLGIALTAGLTAACVYVRAHDDSGSHEHASAKGAKASAKIEGRSGSSLSGRATFTESAGGVLVEIEVQNTPPGWHAVHVHEKGDCSAADGTSAGGHFNPGTKDHGSPHAPDHHAGDLGNMWVDEKGIGHHVLLMPDLTVAAGESSVRGRAIIVHGGVDDLMTQPTGNAGGRIGCGEIQ